MIELLYGESQGRTEMSARFFMLRVFCIIRRGGLKCPPVKAFFPVKPRYHSENVRFLSAGAVKAFFPVKPRYHSENVRFLSAGAHIGAPLQCKGNVCYDFQELRGNIVGAD